MSDSLTWIADQLRVSKDHILDLATTNPSFNALCERYATVASDIRTLEQSAEKDAELQVVELRKRRAAVEEELHAMMSANLRT